MIGFLAIFAAALSGLGGLGVWTIAATAIALAALSYHRYADLYERGRAMGLTDALNTTLLASLGNALMATGGAYAFGLVMRLI